MKTFVRKSLDCEQIFWYIIEKNKCSGEAREMTKTYRIKSRLRFTFFVAAAIILITVSANFILGLSTASSLTVPQYTEVTVDPGDTLWSIASEYIGDSQDVRKSVYEISSLNDISASELYPGMTIMVPVN